MPMPRRTDRELRACRALHGGELFDVFLEWVGRARADALEALVNSSGDITGRYQGRAQVLGEILDAFEEKTLSRALDALENKRPS